MASNLDSERRDPSSNLWYGWPQGHTPWRMQNDHNLRKIGNFIALKIEDIDIIEVPEVYDSSDNKLVERGENYIIHDELKLQIEDTFSGDKLDEVKEAWEDIITLYVDEEDESLVDVDNIEDLGNLILSRVDDEWALYEPAEYLVAYDIDNSKQYRFEQLDPQTYDWVDITDDFFIDLADVPSTYEDSDGDFLRVDYDSSTDEYSVVFEQIDQRVDVWNDGSNLLEDVTNLNFADNVVATKIDDQQVDIDSTRISISETGDDTTSMTNIDEIICGSNIQLNEDSSGVAEIVAIQDPDTRVNIKNDGTDVLSDSEYINFLSDISASDDGNGGVEVKVDNLDNFDTDDLSEGDTNLYFEGQRAIDSSFDDSVFLEGTDITINKTTSGGNITDITINADDQRPLTSESGVDVVGSTEELNFFGDHFDITDNSPTAQIEISATTDEISEGSTNLYYTDTRVHDSLSASDDLSYDGSGTFSVTTYKSSDFDTDFSNKTTDDLSEGSNNLYHNYTTKEVTGLSDASTDQFNHGLNTEVPDIEIYDGTTPPYDNWKYRSDSDALNVTVDDANNVTVENTTGGQVDYTIKVSR